MALPFWQSLEKNQDDGETIEEAIDRKIAAHNDDQEAHQAANQSVNKHKTETMLDHPAGSVAIDKFAQARVLVTAFESLDGWGDFFTGSGSLSQDFGNVQLATGSTSGSYTAIDAVPSGWSGFDAGKQLFWKTALVLSADTNQEARFGVGAWGEGDGISGCGFEVVDGILYAYTEDNTTVNQVTVSGVDFTAWHIYEVRTEPANDRFRFFVDGTEVATVDRTYTEPVDDGLAVYRLKNTAAEQKFMHISDLIFQTER